MAINDSTHPLRDVDTDEIEPAVAEALTPYQVEWLCRQCSDLGLKKLQILRQSLFEWISEHPDYRFSATTLGREMRVALEKFIKRHNEEFVCVPRVV
jgi:hypothetical protein